MYGYFVLNVWGTLQDRVYKTKPANIQNLRDRKVSEVEHMSKQDIKNSIETSMTSLSNGTRATLQTSHF